MNVVQLKLRGGLGNQLFQFCAGLYLARHLQRKLVIDDSALRKHPNSAKRNWISKLDVEFYSQIGLQKVNRTLSLIVANFDRFLYGGSSFLTEDLQVKSISINEKKRLILSGYFQTAWFPEQVNANSALSSIRERLFPLDSMPKWAISDNVAAVHFRLGDYVSHDWQLPFDWYFDRIQELLGQGISTFAVFTDDIQQVKKELESKFGKQLHFRFPEMNFRFSPIEVLFFMSRFSTFVSSNSTLAWWSSYTDAANKNLILSPWEDEIQLPNWRHIPK